jgi:hypothetical protein
MARAAPWVVALLGCYQSYQDVAAADTDGRGEVRRDGHGDDDAPADIDVEVDDAADGDADARADGEVDADADVDDGGVVACAGGWFDPTSGLCWQDPPSDTALRWDDAIAHCDGLSLAGFGPGSWRLPTIDELRSLVRGCLASETGGVCTLVDSCTDSSCWSELCSGSYALGGPGAGGCYWPTNFTGRCYAFWSSTFWPPIDFSEPISACFVLFSTGLVSYVSEGNGLSVRCVRSGP